MIARLSQRVHEGLSWRLRPLLRAYEYHVVGRAAAHSGMLARCLRYPIPGFVPWRGREVHVVRRQALGDVLLCTPSFRRIKELNPECRIVFYTDFAELVKGLQCLDEVRPYGEQPAWAVELAYEGAIPTRRHLAQVIGDGLGVDVHNVRPSVVVDQERVERYDQILKQFVRPWVVISRRAGPWTPNKDWPDTHWGQLILRLSQRATLIEIGQQGESDDPAARALALDLRGKTSLPDLVALLSAADLHVGPVSGPVHVAAAVGTPSVVICGGYEDANCARYPGNVVLATSVPCSPCWLRTPCPHDRVCLSQIGVDRVLNVIETLWTRLRPV